MIAYRLKGVDDNGLRSCIVNLFEQHKLVRCLEAEEFKKITLELGRSGRNGWKGYGNCMWKINNGDLKIIIHLTYPIWF